MNKLTFKDYGVHKSKPLFSAEKCSIDFVCISLIDGGYMVWEH